MSRTTAETHEPPLLLTDLLRARFVCRRPNAQIPPENVGANGLREIVPAKPRVSHGVGRLWLRSASAHGRSCPRVTVPGPCSREHPRAQPGRPTQRDGSGAHPSGKGSSTSFFKILDQKKRVLLVFPTAAANAQGTAEQPRDLARLRFGSPKQDAMASEVTRQCRP